MENLSDVHVVLDIQKTVPPTNFGKLAVFVKSTVNSFVEYSTQEEALSKESDIKLQNLIRGFFNQEEHANGLFVIKYDDLTKALDTYYSANFEFMTVLTDDKSKGDVLTLSNYVEGKNTKFAVIGVSGVDQVTPDTDVTTILSPVLNLEGNSRTIAFVAGKDDIESAYAVGALIGTCGNKTVGSITWKFKNLKGVKPINFTAFQLTEIHKVGAITYIEKSGIQQTSEGLTLGGEFIDALHGDDWVKSEIESSIQNLLSSSDKVSYDSNGIAQIQGVVTNVLMQATTNGIILVNPETNSGSFSVIAKSRNEVSSVDIASRAYNGLSYTYTRAGAIHTVTVHGKVML